MIRFTGLKAPAIWLLLLEGLFPCLLIAADATSPSSASPTPSAAKGADQQAQEEDQMSRNELDEILVEGRKPLRDAQKIIDWLARLVGRFVVDGTVDLHGNADAKEPRKVQGRVDCTGFGPAPGVYCQLKVRWPEVEGPQGKVLLGGVSTLNPANILFGFEPDRIGIRHMLVDSNGIADAALGYLLTGSTLVSRTKCANVPGQCERIVRITAEPDLKEVEMNIDLEVDFKKAVTFRLVMHRVPGSPSVVFPGTTK